MKAYRVTLWDTISIIAAETASKARYTVYRRVHEAGWSTVKFGQIDVARDSGFDRLVAAALPGETLGWRDFDYAWGCLISEFEVLKAQARQAGYSSIERWQAAGRVCEDHAADGQGQGGG